MGIVPKVFTGGSPAQATYDYVDIADGSGVITLYGAVDRNLSGLLVKNSSIYSSSIVTTGRQLLSGAAYYIRQLFVDFDTMINKPITLKGHAYFNIPLAIHAAGQSVNTAYANIWLKKWDGTTETNIVSGSTNIITCTTNGSGVESYAVSGAKMLFGHFIVPLTSYKRGETLRVRVEGWGDSDNDTSTAWIQLAHDPADRTYTHSEVSGAFVITDHTRLTCYLPTIINL